MLYDIIIVGAGPAGLTAALYAKRANKSVLILEGKTYGGQIINTPNIVNYPGIPKISGFDYATNLYSQVLSVGVQIVFEPVLRIEENRTVVTDKNTYQGKTVIIATGAENRQLNLPNEDKLVGKGISYCAVCDGNFFKEKTVAVNGGGNTALEDALYLSDIASKVYLIHRRKQFRGDEKYLQEILTKSNIEILYDSSIISLNGEEQLTSVDVKNVSGELKNIPVDALFVAIGQTPKNEIFQNIVDLDENGYIISPDGVHTKIEKIYVAGDCRVKDLRQLTTAVADGSIAATVAMKEMEK